jgi:LacI family transcriptional regulator
LAYVVSLPAKRLSSGQSETIGLIVHNASWHYIQDVHKGVLETARKFGYYTLLHPCDTTQEGDTQEVLNLVFHRLVDGLIFTPPADNAGDLIQELKRLGTPFICLSPKDREACRPYVTTTDRQGAFDMTTYLIGLGHTRIGFIQGPNEQQAPHDRFTGYLQALQAASIPRDAAIIASGDDHFESGQSAARKLLDAKSRPTAIFCNNDEMAAGAISAIYQAGLHVPADISVAGFDNIPLSRQIWPSLTTVEQPISRMAENATTQLLKVLNGETDIEPAIKIATRLVIRNSTDTNPQI